MLFRSGGLEDANKLLGFENFMFGINGVVTFKNSQLPQSLPVIPLSRIVLETDSPYLAPVPKRGKRNESSYLSNILLRLSEIYGLDKQELAKITSNNTKRVFEL